MIRPFDPKLDLSISRVIRAPRAAVWSAWTEPRNLEQWWVPKPALCSVLALEVRPGGAFATEISEDGSTFVPHMNACFLDVAEGRRIVFTDALLGGWRPSDHGFITAVISLEDHPDGTEYLAHVMHKDGADRNRHAELGFYDGWGTVIGQLAALLERQS